MIMTKRLRGLFKHKGSGDGTLLKDPNAPKLPTKTVKKESEVVNESLPKETNKVSYKGIPLGKFFYPDRF